MKNALQIFARLVGGLSLAVITAAAFAAPWICEPSDIDRVLSFFGK